MSSGTSDGQMNGDSKFHERQGERNRLNIQKTTDWKNFKPCENSKPIDTRISTNSKEKRYEENDNKEHHNKLA